jgi:hypothetical protein
MLRTGTETGKVVWETNMTFGDDARRPVGGRDDEIAPECRPAIDARLFLMRVHTPNDPADIAGPAVDLVEHAPGVGDVEKTVLSEWGCFNEFVAGAACKCNRIGEL